IFRTVRFPPKLPTSRQIAASSISASRCVLFVAFRPVRYTSGYTRTNPCGRAVGVYLGVDPDFKLRRVLARVRVSRVVLHRASRNERDAGTRSLRPESPDSPTEPVPSTSHTLPRFRG